MSDADKVCIPLRCPWCSQINNVRRLPVSKGRNKKVLYFCADCCCEIHHYEEIGLLVAYLIREDGETTKLKTVILL